MYRSYTEPSAPVAIDSPPTYNQAVGLEPASVQSEQETQNPVITTQPTLATPNQAANLASDDNASQNSERRRRRREADAFCLDCCDYNEGDCICAYLLCKYICQPFGNFLAHCCQCCAISNPDGSSGDCNCCDCDCDCNDCDGCGCGDGDCDGCDCGDCDCSGCDCGDCDCNF